MEFGELLGNAGLKCTRQRMDILEILSEATLPMRAEDIFTKAHNMSLSTVYRAMELFCEKGIAECETINNSPEHYYSLKGRAHYHYAICLGCNELRHVEVCPVHEHGLDINGFNITGHKLELYGFCSKCAQKV